MLRITVEIVPFGDETKAKEIGRGYIVNESTSINNKANYDCTFEEYGINEKFSVKLKLFDRARGFWALIGEALKGK